MPEDTATVLRLLAAGDLTVEEAEARLAATDDSRPAQAPPPPGADPSPGPGPAKSRRHEAASGKLTVDHLVALAAVGASPEWVRRMQRLDVTGLDTDTLIAFASLNVSPEWVEELVASDLFDELSADQVVGLAAQGVSPDYVREMKAALQAQE